MFQCMRETTKGSNKDAFPFAAGGRYDSLIREFRGTVTGKSGEYHAVGFNLSWQKMAAGIAKSQKEKVTGKSFLKKQEELRGIWMTRRVSSKSQKIFVSVNLFELVRCVSCQL